MCCPSSYEQSLRSLCFACEQHRESAMFHSLWMFCKSLDLTSADCTFGFVPPPVYLIWQSRLHIYMFVLSVGGWRPFIGETEYLVKCKYLQPSQRKEKQTDFKEMFFWKVEILWSIEMEFDRNWLIACAWIPILINKSPKNWVDVLVGWIPPYLGSAWLQQPACSG